ncbi:MAG: mono/diheme cytochrome c family protein, partial [Algoriphagus sp.]
MLKKSLFWICGGMLLFLMYWVVSCRSQQPVDYSTQVKPIINKNCIACHGGVKKQGGFSLLFEEEAKAKLKSGAYGIVSGDARASEMIRRLSLQDPEERMPFEHSALPDEEIELLTRWVNEGANWGVHWAYKALDKVAVPKVKSEWPKNEIDAFVFSKAEEHKLTVSEKADPSVLARRLQLDIIGFPQNTETKTNFTKDPSDENYELLVDELLYSPHYGEKWTSMWLDLARYADTKGYERDGNRDIWRYRDWLIEAFNEDMPYNQFLTEQIAGDLLPEATDDQLIATAFHRNTMTNDEGGTSNEEYRVAAVVDRVNTTWEATMGTTFACIQCHSHPYDPFTHEEYYKFMGFFNNT